MAHIGVYRPIGNKTRSNFVSGHDKWPRCENSGDGVFGNLWTIYLSLKALQKTETQSLSLVLTQSILGLWPTCWNLILKSVQSCASVFFEKQLTYLHVAIAYFTRSINCVVFKSMKLYQNITCWNTRWTRCIAFKLCWYWSYSKWVNISFFLLLHSLLFIS